MPQQNPNLKHSKRTGSNLSNSMKIALWPSKMLMNTHVSLVVTKMNILEKQSHQHVFYKMNISSDLFEIKRAVRNASCFESQYLSTLKLLIS